MEGGQGEEGVGGGLSGCRVLIRFLSGPQGIALELIMKNGRDRRTLGLIGSSTGTMGHYPGFPPHAI